MKILLLHQSSHWEPGASSPALLSALMGSLPDCPPLPAPGVQGLPVVLLSRQQLLRAASPPQDDSMNSPYLLAEVLETVELFTAL